MAADARDSSKPAAWITGAGGLIGSYIVQTASRYGQDWKVIGLTRSSLDLTDFAAVGRKFRDERPGLVIHCAALSRSPACQADPPLARLLNIDVTRCLAELSAEIQFFLFSSDLVFDGEKGNYDETAMPNPLSVYAETKIAAEQTVLPNPKHTVVRTSLNGGISSTGDRGFNEEMCNAWRIGKTLNLFVDEFRCPIPAVETARAIWEIVGQGATGLYHLAGAERLSRFEMGQLVAQRWPQLAPKIVPASRKDYQGAPRPPDTSMNCSKIQRLLSFPLPSLREWLRARPDEPF